MFVLQVPSPLHQVNADAPNAALVNSPPSTALHASSALRVLSAVTWDNALSVSTALSLSLGTASAFHVVVDLSPMLTKRNACFVLLANSLLMKVSVKSALLGVSQSQKVSADAARVPQAPRATLHVFNVTLVLQERSRLKDLNVRHALWELSPWAMPRSANHVAVAALQMRTEQIVPCVLWVSSRETMEAVLPVR